MTGLIMNIQIWNLLEAPSWALGFWQQAGEGETAKQAPGLLQIVFSGGPIGIAIMLAIIATSLLAAYLVFDHLLSLRRKELLPDGLSDLVRQALLGGDLPAARAACEARPSLLSFVLMHGLAELEYGWPAVEKAVEESLAEQSARLLRKLEYLSVIGNIAPMLGLLGTVVGMVLAFKKVAESKGAAVAADLADGIYLALVTTVQGLIVAIPALAFHAYFRNRIEHFGERVNATAEQVFVNLRRAKSSRKSDG